MRSHSAIKNLQRNSFRQKVAKLQLLVLTEGAGEDARRTLHLPTGTYSGVNVTGYKRALDELYRQVFGMAQVFTPNGGSVHQNPHGYSKKVRRITPAVMGRHARTVVVREFIETFFKKDAHSLYL